MIIHPPLSVSRRQFLRATSAAMVATAFSSSRVMGANQKVRIAVVGMGRRSKSHVQRFLNLPDVELVAICDPDTAQMDKCLQNIAKMKQSAEAEGKPFPDVRPDTVVDYRKLYERSDIDAVVISSTNYWHTLHAIHAVQSGKHVYVEKPVTFTHWEGMQLEAASTRYGKIIAAGYQNRSDPGPQDGIRYVQEGNLGKIKKVRVLCYRNRDSIGGPLQQALKPPATIDYDLWLGPAPEHTIKRPELHYDWHWDFHTGNGDMGNQSVHEIDMVYWLLGHPGLPSEVRCFGNRFAWNDAGDTPNMQTVWCRWGGTEVILETNDMKLSPDRNVSPHRMGTRVGIIAECEKGILKGGRGGMMAVELDEKTVIQKFKGNGGKSHQNSFIEAVRSNDISKFPLTIAQAHVSESVMHLGNASYRLGQLDSSSALKKNLGQHDDLLEIVNDQNKQLSDWGIKDPQYYLGKSIEVDPATQEVKTKGVGLELTGPHYRPGFEVPKLA
jgi:predicted dehydrogenase